MLTDNSTGGLSLYVNRHFNVYGTVSNNLVVLCASSLSTVYQDTGAPPIHCDEFKSWSGPSEYQMMSDLRFESCMVDFYGHLVHMSEGAQHHSISLSGGRLYRVELDSGGFAGLSLDSNAYLYAVYADDIILQGDVLFYQDISFQNLQIAAGCVVNTWGGGSYNLYVYQTLSCLGSIQTSTGNVYMRLYGDCYNYGTMWCQYVYFMSDTQQKVFQAGSAASFHNNTFGKPSSVAGGSLMLLSDLRFQDTTVDMNWRVVDCFGGGLPRGLHLAGGKIYRSTLDTSGYSSLDLTAGAYLDYVTAGDFVTQGTVKVYQNVVFDSVVNLGTLSGYYGVNELVVHNDLHNWGVITDGTSANLYISLEGDLYTHGPINCYRTNMSGPGNQYVRLGNEYPITCNDFMLRSLWGPAQFWLDSILISSGPSYYDIGIPNTGVWRIVAGTNERFITLDYGTGAALTAPQISSFHMAGDGIQMVWNEVSGASSYLVSEASSPDGTFTDTYRVYDPVPRDGNVTTFIEPGLGQRFYCVKAVD